MNCAGALALLRGTGLIVLVTILSVAGATGAVAGEKPRVVDSVRGFPVSTPDQMRSVSTALDLRRDSTGGLQVNATQTAASPSGAADHAAHHPNAASADPAPPVSASAPTSSAAVVASPNAASAASGAPMGAMMQDMMGGPMGAAMADMMRGCRGDECGRDARLDKLLYPQLMALPELPPERRASVEQLAHHRMHEGVRQLSALSSAASLALQHNDYAGLQAASDRMRVAWREFDSGLSAQRALKEGRPPRGIALEWFRSEMNLVDPSSTPAAHGVFGLSGFHYFTMALLLAFALLAGWTYVARTRRTNAVLATLRLGAPTPPTPAMGPALERTPDPPAATAARTPASISGGGVPKLRVARIFQETHNVKTFRLAPVEGVGTLPFEFEPGQFLTLSMPAGRDQVKRSYSISSSPCCHGWCDLTVKHEGGGIVSSFLHEEVKEGDILDASGPYGRFTFRGVESESVVFLAGGVGITPLMSSIRYLTDQSWNGRIDLVYGCKNLASAIFREELALLARRHANLHVTLVLSDEESDGWTGARGHITSELLRQIPEIRSRRIHLCGPQVMMDGVRGELAVLGIAPASVKSELFLSPPKATTPGAATPPVDTASCSFARSGKAAPLLPDQSILEAAESVGVRIENACRQGYCGICKVKLLSGTVAMDVDDGLTALDRSASMILACQAKSSADVSVDA